MLTRRGPDPGSSFLISASHVELRDMTMGEWWVDAPAHNVILRNIHASLFVIASQGTRAPRDISVVGGDYGPASDQYSTVGVNGLGTTAVPTRILIQGVRFHDYKLSPGSSSHVECLQVFGADGLTIRNNRFRNCYVFDILLNKVEGERAPSPSNILIENNFLDCCGVGSNYSIRLSDSWGSTWDHVSIRNNSSDMAMNLGTGTTYHDVEVAANIAPRLDGTPPGVSIDWNVWYQGSKIARHDFVKPAGFVDPAAGNFHLLPQAAAINQGGPTAPPNDIDGQRRPIGPAPDAGADEVG